MKVKKIMTTEVAICRIDDDLVRVVEIMRQKDCGIIPVIDADNRVAGMISDRDVCLAAVAAPEKKLSDIKAGEITGGKVVSCASGDKIETALKKMRKYKVKRLSVVDTDGEIIGILSVTDVLLSVRKDKVLKKQIYSTLKSIAEPRPIVLREIIADIDDGGE